jgi:hypothetical protein
MHLPIFKQTSESQPPREYLFSVEIASESVKTSIWSVINGKIQVLSVGRATSWDGNNTESLVAACDESLSDATQKIDPSGKIQPEKMILGLPPDWVSEDKIAPERLKILRTLTKELSLKAVGFVIIPQALVRYLHQTEGVPPTSVIVGIRNEFLEITVSRLGKIDTSEQVRRSENIALDVAEGLSRFMGENMLPSRILLYDSGRNLEDIKQEMLTFAWQSPQYKLPFLHFPKIEILHPDFSIKAISQAGGDEVAKSIGLIKETPQQNSELQSGPDSNVSPEELGFFSDVDVAISQENAKQADEGPTNIEETNLEEEKKQSPHPSPKRNFHLPKVIPFRLKLSSKPLFFIIVFLIISSLVFWYFWFQLKADILITISPQPLSHKLELQIDPQIDSPDYASNTLPASERTIEVPGEKSKSTSGSKIIGDKAIGEVSIINGTASPRTFPAGTTIASPSGLKFTLDTVVNVASASGTADPNSYQPGKASVKITASAIGSDSNLSAGTQFRIGSFSSLDYVARNESAFSGGTSRQVQTVSSKDIAELRSQLVVELSEQSQKQLLSDNSSGSLIIPQSITFKNQSENSNHQVDEVSDTVTLTLLLKATALSITNDNLDKIISEQISSVIPNGFTQSKEIDYKFEVLGIDGQKYRISVDAATELLPIIDENPVLKRISGKGQSEAEIYLKSLPNVSNVEISILPKLLSWIKILPHVEQNIRLSTTTTD